MEEVSIEKVIGILSRLGVRVTPQRIIITKIILDNVKNHPSFKEIHETVQKQLPRIGISTIFNTMKMLEEAGVIRIFEYNGETHIDSPEPHVNVYCRNNGKIIDVEDTVKPIIEDLEDKIRELGIKVENINVMIEGVCPNN
jgi:Fur family peroxide stress response transcriptional regulator